MIFEIINLCSLIPSSTNLLKPVGRFLVLCLLNKLFSHPEQVLTLFGSFTKPLLLDSFNIGWLSREGFPIILASNTKAPRPVTLSSVIRESRSGTSSRATISETAGSMTPSASNSPQRRNSFFEQYLLPTTSASWRT